MTPDTLPPLPEPHWRWQRIVLAAEAVVTGGADKIDHFEVPAHLIAALAIALESPQHPAPAEPAEPAPLWAPEGLEAHDDDPSCDRCLKCCLNGSRQCFDTPCMAAHESQPHPSGKAVYFTRKP